MDDITLLFGDCLVRMGDLQDGSVDAIITDLPYGTTQCKWDAVIPFDKLWEKVFRVLKSNGVFITTASQPFSSFLIASNPALFCHEWIWIKNKGSNFANTVREPFKEHESVLVFSKGKWTYNKQMQERTGGGADRAKYGVEFNSQEREGTRKFEGRKKHRISELRVPSSWQKFNTETGKHPTQKPVALYEYLVKTYTNEFDTVLDPCMGSGTTLIACQNTNRKGIGIEKDEKIYNIAVERVILQ